VTLVLIAVLGALGSLARYFTAYRFNGSLTFLPGGTLLVNVLGCLAIGVLHGMGERARWLTPDLRIGITVGLLGGFTTFSAYAFEVGRFLEEGRYGPALLYWVLSPVLGLAATVIGAAVTRWCGSH